MPTIVERSGMSDGLIFDVDQDPFPGMKTPPTRVRETLLKEQGSPPCGSKETLQLLRLEDLARHTLTLALVSAFYGGRSAARRDRGGVDSPEVNAS